MDDLRWVLLLVGVVVVVAIYLSGRFEGEDWKRERKQFRDDKLRKSIQKAHRKKTPPAPARFVEKQEPSMSAVPEMANDMLTVDKTREKALSQEQAAAQETPVQKPSEQKISEQKSPEQKLPEQKLPEQKSPPQEAAVKEAPAEETLPPKTEDVSAKAEKETAPLEESSTEAKEEEATPPVAAETPESVAEKGADKTNEEKIEALFDADIEDEITDVEIPVDLAVAEAEIQIGEQAQGEESEQAEMTLDIEPLVLSVSVLADDADGINGQELQEALEAEGLAYGAMRIFHFYDPGKEDIVDTDDAVFSAANLLEPGYFELEKMEGMHTPGLMLFCQLPGPLEGEAALELMLDKARGLAVRLHGQMCDDKRNRFTAQAKTLYQDRISAFNRELMLARKKNA
jgi:cell division protein ZipA